MPKISVIIPLYNQGCFLRDSVDSLKTQTFTDWECVIVNDGSTDNSLDIAEQLVGSDKRFKVISRDNGGLAAARNTGINNCNGEYVALLDSDDCFLPFYLESMLEPLTQKADVDLSWCKPQETDYYLRPKAPFQRSKIGISANYSNILLSSKPAFRLVWDNPLLTCGQLWRARSIISLGYDENLRSNEDWDVLCRYEQSGGKFVHVPGLHSYYRRHGSSLNKNARRMVETRIRCGLKNYANSPDSNVARLSRLALTLSTSNLAHGDDLIQAIPGDENEDELTIESMLADVTLAPFASLWCGGVVRRAPPNPPPRAKRAICLLKKKLPYRVTTWKIVANRIIENMLDSVTTHLLVNQ